MAVRKCNGREALAKASGTPARLTGEVTMLCAATIRGTLTLPHLVAAAGPVVMRHACFRSGAGKSWHVAA
jgi:hypothetical protein